MLAELLDLGGHVVGHLRICLGESFEGLRVVGIGRAELVDAFYECFFFFTGLFDVASESHGGCSSGCFKPQVEFLGPVVFELAPGSLCFGEFSPRTVLWGELVSGQDKVFSCRNDVFLTLVVLDEGSEHVGRA